MTPALSVWVATADETALELFPGGSGLVVGPRFGTRIGEREAARIRATGGRWLLEHGWGHYVALWEDTRGWHVVRDPSGQLPCYRSHSRDCQILFSDLDDVAPFLRLSDIDWPFLRRYLDEPDRRSHETALTSVSEILAGEHLSLGSSSSGGTPERVQLWRPADICRRGWIDEAERARAELRAVTHEVIAAWGGRSKRILHHLSGGLDSSVVLGCAHALGFAERIVAVNRFTRRAGEDERPFARAAAARASVKLIEREWDEGESLVLGALLRHAPLMPRPSVQVLALLETAMLDALALEAGADVQWTGQGGDHLFFQLTTPLTAADVLIGQGVGARFRRAMVDAARLTRRSYWSVAAAVVRSASDHRWGELPPAKQYQAEILMGLANRPDPIRARRVVPELHTLLSQPLMELALCIPTDRLIEGGRTRALARAAFQDLVPEEILRRDSKGDTTIHLATLLRRNLTFLREFLLEGRLVRERLIERSRLEPYLLHGSPLRSGELTWILACLSAEIWLERVSGVPSPRLGDGQ